MKYFTNIKTLEDLKKAYKKLATKNHPDCGGSEDAMKAINAEYDEVFKRVKDVHVNKDGKTYTKENNETPEMFRDIVEALLRMQAVNIEIIGCFIWVSGNTKPYKDELKSLGFKWHSSKGCWYKAPEGYRKFGKSNYSMDTIRSMYGVQFEGTGEEDTSNRLTA